MRVWTDDEVRVYKSATELALRSQVKDRDKTIEEKNRKIKNLEMELERCR